MKKSLLLLILCLSIVLPTYATHLMGGQITARQLDSLRYEVTLTVYRDTLGIAVNAQETLTYNNSVIGVSFTSTVNVSPANNIMNGVEEYTYIDTATFPADGEYRVSYTSCCRNGAISNLSQPLSENIYLYTLVTVGANITNSTPVMLNLPVTIAPLMQPWVYNPLPYDADGDSLSWSLDVPWGDIGLPCVGYTAPAADTTGPFALNPYTGEIDWTPSMTGNWNATVLVREYRNGVQIGEIRRDMQILTVIDTSNSSRLAFAGTPALHQNAQGYYEYVIPANVPFHLIMNANDADGDLLKMEALGSTFEKTVNKSLVTTTSANGHAQAIFDWTPATADISARPYIDVFRGSEYHGTHVYMTDLTVAITVAATAPNGLQQLDTKTSITTYPNPANNHIFIEVNSAQEATASLHLFDLSGRVAATVIDGTVHIGRTVISTEIQHLPTGVYILSGMCDGERVNRKVVVE